jgi:hypothetical protein
MNPRVSPLWAGARPVPLRPETPQGRVLSTSPTYVVPAVVPSEAFSRRSQGLRMASGWSPTLRRCLASRGGGEGLMWCLGSLGAKERLGPVRVAGRFLAGVRLPLCGSDRRRAGHDARDSTGHGS